MARFSIGGIRNGCGFRTSKGEEGQAAEEKKDLKKKKADNQSEI